MATRAKELHPSPKVLAPATNMAEAAKALEAIRAVFREMDVACTGRVSQKSFAAYLQRNPAGWPLADLLQNQPADIQKQIVTFWFRKLDLDSEGSFTEAELVAFFEAFRDAKAKEVLYADFLMNLFDANFDAKLDREEYANMLRVLLGREPNAATIAKVSQDGLGRDGLVQLLHAIHCDLNLLEGKQTAPRRGGACCAGDALATAVVVVGVAVVAFAAVQFFTKRR